MVTAAKTRIMIVDDHALFREGLRRLLGSEPDLEIVETCGRLEEALRTIGTRTVDLILLDYDMGEVKGSEFLSRARASGYSGPVLVLTAGVPARDLRDLFALGAVGVAYKHSSPEQLLECIRRVKQGGAWIDQSSLAAILDLEAPRHTSHGPRLTEREKSVLRGVLEGLTNKEIGSRLNASETAIKATLQQLFSKTGVRTRSQLVRLALEELRDQI